MILNMPANEFARLAQIEIGASQHICQPSSCFHACPQTSLHDRRKSKLAPTNTHFDFDVPAHEFAQPAQIEIGAD